ncbi:MAG: MATE family efflux transporter [Ruminococcaceae bacterium]|nr:MATE family efflux transporter [Oscillospiraceae bacterium]
MKENKMGIMPVGRLLFTMALPLALSMLVQALYNIVDSVFVSQISDVNNDALTAVGLAFPVQNIMIGIASGIAVGVNALMSRSLGAKDFKQVHAVAQNGLFLTMLGMILTALFGIFCAEPFMRSQSTNEAVIAYGIDYIRIITIASFGIFGEVLLERLLQATGRTTYTLFTQGTGAVLNMILDPIFIFGWGPIPRMEVKGAAIATVIGQVVAFSMAIWFNVRKNPEVSLSFGSFRPNAKACGRILGIGIPSVIMVAIGSLMYYCFNLVLAGMGDKGEVGTTVFGAYYKLQSFIFMPIFGMSNAVLAITAFNYGAKKPDRILRTIKLGAMAASGIMLLGVIAFELLPKQLLGFFNPDAAMLEVGVPALRLLCLPFIFAGACIIFGNVFQALGKSIYSMITSIARQLVVLIPAAYLLSLSGNIDLVWLSYPIAEVASLIISITMMVVLYRKKIKPLYFSSCNSDETVL